VTPPHWAAVATAGRAHAYCASVPDQLQMTSDRVEGCVVLSVVGEIDAMTAPELLAAIRWGLREAGRGPLVVDLGAVTFLGSAGLAVLVGAVSEADLQGTSLRIVVDHTRPVLRPLEVTGLGEVLPVFDTVRNALDA
jgi:anti-sigma B factor antagonist